MVQYNAEDLGVCSAGSLIQDRLLWLLSRFGVTRVDRVECVRSSTERQNPTIQTNGRDLIR